MRKIITSALVFALVACASAAFGGQAWTDCNGDGQPDSAPFLGRVASDVVVVDLYIDSQSFTFTSYNIWAEWNNMSRSGAGQNLMTGCSNDPNDTFSHPQGNGFAGSVCTPAKHGIFLVARFGLHIDAVPATVAPIIDPNNPFNVFSLLSSPSGYMLFETRHGSTFEGPNATENKSWGEIKGLYK